MKVFASLAAGTTLALGSGLVESCDNRLIGLTRYVDPCGTQLSCPPGSFEANAARINDPGVDPACVVPGTPLGTIRDLPGC